MTTGKIGVGEPIGAVNGAQVELFSGDYGAVNVIVGGPLAEIVGIAGGWNNPKFQKQDVKLITRELRGFGIGFEISLIKNRSNGYSPAFPK
ncbi:MAG: hypothetical protein IOD05_01560 [Rhodobacter sp.]|nr:hypothetical protein [Rhodobacter sp.]MCA3501956.1 hypothetical protein [Rhodobacter sp.]